MKIVYTNPGKSVAIFTIEGALDTLEVPQFLDVITPVIDQGIIYVVLNCTDMPYLTSSGLRAIMLVGKTVQGKKGKLMIYGIAGLAKNIYESSGFAQVFPIIINLDEVLKTLENAQ